MALAARRFFLGDTEEGLYPLDMAELQNTSQPWPDFIMTIIYRFIITLTFGPKIY